MLSVGATVQFILNIDFVLIKKVGWEGGGWGAYSRHAVYMVAALAGYRTALVGTGETISHLVSINGHRKHSSLLVGAPFRDL